MAKVKRANRKANDEDIIKLNNLGLSLKTIGRALGIHPTTVFQRIKTLGLDVIDTRRSFAEDVFLTLSFDQQEWLSATLESQGINIRQYIRNTIIEQYRSHVNEVESNQKHP